MSWKVSDGDSGMFTLGPTGEVNGEIVTELSIVDQDGGASELGGGCITRSGWGWNVTVIIVFYIPGH